jgi:hypothetical protein
MYVSKVRRQKKKFSLTLHRGINGGGGGGGGGVPGVQPPGAANSKAREMGGKN